MELIIKINVDNDAFQVDRRTEVRRILETITRLNGNSIIFEDGDKMPLFDTNGNKVGSAEIRGKLVGTD
jgi:hypothetical protein